MISYLFIDWFYMYIPYTSTRRGFEMVIRNNHSNQPFEAVIAQALPQASAVQRAAVSE